MPARRLAALFPLQSLRRALFLQTSVQRSRREKSIECFAIKTLKSMGAWERGSVGAWERRSVGAWELGKDKNEWLKGRKSAWPVI